MTRRTFVSALAAGSALQLAGRASSVAPSRVTLRLASARIEVAKGCFVETTAYNGSVPGPLVRLREGVAANVEIFN